MTSEDSAQPTALEQSSLTGEDVGRVECGYEGDMCSNPALYRGEVFVFDGGGWVYENTLMCEACADTWFEPGMGNSREDLERLKPGERYVGETVRTQP